MFTTSSSRSILDHRKLYRNALDSSLFTRTASSAEVEQDRISALRGCVALLLGRQGVLSGDRALSRSHAEHQDHGKCLPPPG